MKLTPWEPDLRTIADRIENADIDLQPNFQRQEVWSPTKKKRLIDTILRGWSIPPVHLVVTTDNRMEVLDGQQRLASIRDFFRGEFAIDGHITPIDQRLLNLHGVFYGDLDPSVRRTIDQYPLRCFRVTDYFPDEPSELFYRLNQPTMLTAGEQRNALYGPAREQLKAVVQEFEKSGNDRGTIGFSNVRLAYDDIIARLLFFLESGTFGVKGTEALISERFRNRSQFPHDVIDRAERAIELFAHCRNEIGGWKFNKASLLSWLLFFTRFRDRAPRRDFMAMFLHADSLAGTNFVIDALRVFDDRASLRVTDVSSVVYRDFSLWYAYYFLADRNLPDPIPASPIQRVHTLLEAGSTGTFEEVLATNLDIERWSVLL